MLYVCMIPFQEVFYELPRILLALYVADEEDHRSYREHCWYGVVWGKCHRISCGMRRVPDSQERLAGLFVVVGATIVFAPVIWVLQRWGEAVARDPADAWGARWLGEHVSANPYLTGGALILGVLLSSGLVMLVVVHAAKRLAARVVSRGRSPVPGNRDNGSED